MVVDPRLKLLITRHLNSLNFDNPSASTLPVPGRQTLVKATNHETPHDNNKSKPDELDQTKKPLKASVSEHTIKTTATLVTQSKQSHVPKAHQDAQTKWDDSIHEPKKLTKTSLSALSGRLAKLAEKAAKSTVNRKETDTSECSAKQSPVQKARLTPQSSSKTSQDSRKHPDAHSPGNMSKQSTVQVGHNSSVLPQSSPAKLKTGMSSSLSFSPLSEHKKQQQQHQKPVMNLPPRLGKIALQLKLAKEDKKQSEEQLSPKDNKNRLETTASTVSNTSAETKSESSRKPSSEPWVFVGHSTVKQATAGQSSQEISTTNTPTYQDQKHENVQQKQQSPQKQRPETQSPPTPTAVKTGSPVVMKLSSLKSFLRKEKGEDNQSTKSSVEEKLDLNKTEDKKTVQEDESVECCCSSMTSVSIRDDVPSGIPTTATTKLSKAMFSPEVIAYFNEKVVNNLKTWGGEDDSDNVLNNLVDSHCHLEMMFSK
jgi:hypothetical protein